jgi:large subunit ribosomal protein L1
MATKKKIEDVREDAATQDEIEEVRATEPEVDLPGDAPTAEVVTGTAATEENSVDPIDESGDTDDTDEKTTKAGKRSAKAKREAEEETARLNAKDERSDDDDEPKVIRRSEPNPKNMHGKKFRAAAEKVELGRAYDLTEAIKLAQATATTKFDSSVQIHINLGVDPRQADQMVRASVSLPHGTGKTLRVAVFADGKAAEDAKAAGADIVGTDKLLADIEAGKLEFDILVATPDKMATLGRVAKVLGPRGLMPNPKSGTVTPNAAQAVKDAKGGKVEFRIDKQAIIHQVIGRVSFTHEQLDENAQTLIGAILKAKPSAAKGTYVKAMALSTAMGPGIKLDAAATTAAVSQRK